MKTILKNTVKVLQSDWGPTMKASACVLALAVAVPVAIVWVLAQWLLFTYQRPLAGVLALVPVRGSDASPPQSAPSSRNLTTSDLVKAGASITETELGPIPMTMRMDFGMASPTPPVGLDGLAIVDEAENVAGVRAVECWTDRATGEARFRPVAPQTLVLAPGPRRQRRGSKQPQSPA